jgi:hypothetical protein
MGGFILSGFTSFLLADAVSGFLVAHIADDGIIVATLNGVDPVVTPAATDREKG